VRRRAWLWGRGVQALKTFKTQRRRPRTAEQVESSIRQEWDKISPPKVQQLVSSVPDVYRLMLKEEGMLHSGKHGPVPTFFNPCSGSLSN